MVTSHTVVLRYSSGALGLRRFTASSKVIFSAWILYGATSEPLISGMDSAAIAIAVLIASCWLISLLATGDAITHPDRVRNTVAHNRMCDMLRTILQKVEDICCRHADRTTGICWWRRTDLWERTAHLTRAGGAKQHPDYMGFQS